MRLALAILMALHGIAHMVGFAGSWQLAASSDLPYKTTVLNGRLDLGDTGIRALGLLWVLAALAFVFVAAGAVLEAGWWAKAAVITAVGSLVLTSLELPAARVGLVLNLFLIVVVLLLQRFHLV
ncbi:MAG TPA: hypothetical protein VFZ21_20795 [Gemmatimonadaceae bacterium]|jgi:hypothetical protein|nr:hypothetical protein [Gemmatimonadaceae bacterium]